MVSRKDIVLVNLGPVIGSEQGKLRPAIILQHNALNKTANTIVVVPITSRIYEKNYPMHVPIEGFGLNKRGIVKTEHIRSIDKRIIVKKIGKVDDNIMIKIKEAFLKTCDYY